MSLKLYRIKSGPCHGINKGVRRVYITVVSLGHLGN